MKARVQFGPSNGTPRLRYELSGAFQKVLWQKGSVALHGLKVGTNGGEQCVAGTVQRLAEPGPLQGLVMIVFTDVAAPETAKVAVRLPRAHPRNARLAELERELLQVRSEGRATHEEMQTSQTTGNDGGGVFAWGGKACGKAQMSTKRSLCQRKTEGGLEKWLANLWGRKKITKEAHAGRGQETKWGMSAKKHHHWSVGANSSPPRLCLRLALRRLGR